MTHLPDAEDLNYFKTSQSSPETWMDKACDLIEQAGGTIRRRLFGMEAVHGEAREAYMVEFDLDGDVYRSVWPVLPTRTDSRLAARRQAATMLYHDLKGRAVRYQVMGARAAYLDMLLLPDGRPAAQATAPQLAEHLPYPKLLTSGG